MNINVEQDHKGLPHRPDHSYSSAQLLYDDGLHSIFKFLTLGELQSAVCSCRYWRDAAYSSPCRRESFKFREENFTTRLTSLVQSTRIKQHICGVSNIRVTLDEGHMRLLHQLPRLEEITAWGISPDALHQAAAAGELNKFFPRTLKYLKLREIANESYSPISRILMHIAEAAASLHSVHTLIIQCVLNPLADVSPLARLKSLTHLHVHIGWRGGHSQSDRLIDTLSSFPLLKHLHLEGGPADWSPSAHQLQRLAQPTHGGPCALHTLNMDKVDLTDSHVRSLCAMPSLTQLMINRISPVSLAEIRQLTCVILEDGKYFLEQLVESTSPAPRSSINTLTLEIPGGYLAPTWFFSFAHVSALVYFMPHLQSLTLRLIEWEEAPARVLEALAGATELKEINFSLCSGLTLEHFSSLIVCASSLQRVRISSSTCSDWHPYSSSDLLELFYAHLPRVVIYLHD